MEFLGQPAVPIKNRKHIQKSEVANLVQKRSGLQAKSKPLRDGGDASVLPLTRKRKLDFELYDNSKDDSVQQLQKETPPPAGTDSNLKTTSESSRKKSRKKTTGSNTKEKRLRLFRKHPPRTFLERLERARSQRMFLLDRNRRMAADGSHEEEIFDIAGTTGNIYQVTVSTSPSCTCPDNAKGNQCKHIVYVMVNILKAPEHLSYQLAFLKSELAMIFAAAPATLQSSNGTETTTNDPGNRKAIEGDCPVCVMEFDPGDDIVWCRAACGNNIHRECFQTWAKSKPGQVRCVYCRTPWTFAASDEDLKHVSKAGKKNAEGYVNVAAALGLSGRRDMSSYHQYWVRRQYGYGAYERDDEDDGY